MAHSSRSLQRNALSVLVHSGLLSLAGISSAYATTWLVNDAGDASVGSGNSGSLRFAFNNAADGDTINFDCVTLSCPATITLTSPGNSQGFPGPTALSLTAKSLTIAAATLGDITLQASPGSTSATSLRLFFVDSNAALNLQNLALSGGKVIGGNGGAGGYTGGGGGGLGGAIFSQGGLSLSGTSLSGNQAIGGNGGASSFGYGGGGGLGGDGGNNYYAGGGGTGGNGATGGGGFGGAGGPGLFGEGGGSGGPSGGGAGGAGNVGGGGGGGKHGGGAGSDGGGGGAGAGFNNAGNGGFGGFGGGGGGSFNAGGFGGFASGGGGGFYAGGGGAGFAGGTGARSTFNPSQRGGGGGGALGGAIFVRGGTLNFQNVAGIPAIAGNSVTAGSGNNGGGNGAAFGAGIFLTDSTGAAFDLAGGTMTVADTITGNCGETAACTDGGLSKDGAGTLILSGVDNYNGPTTISAGLLQVDGTLTNSSVIVDGTLGGTGTVQGITLDSGGSIAPGDSAVGTLTGASLTWNGGGAFDFQLGVTATAIDTDLLNLSGALTNGGGTGFVFHFSETSTAPSVGTTYTLINFGSQTGFVAGDFTADFSSLPPLESIAGSFILNPTSLQFTVTSVSSDRIFANGFE